MGLTRNSTCLDLLKLLQQAPAVFVFLKLGCCCIDARDNLMKTNTLHLQKSFCNMATKLVFHERNQRLWRTKKLLDHGSPVLFFITNCQSLLDNVCCAAILRIAHQLHTEYSTNLATLVGSTSLQDHLDHIM